LCAEKVECISADYKHSSKRCYLSKTCTMEKSRKKNGMTMLLKIFT
jgi:hypothetical protein